MGFYKLRDWILSEKLVLWTLWQNESYGAIEFVEEYFEYSKNLWKFWFWISRNPNAIHILLKNIDKINEESIYWNPRCIDILLFHPEWVYGGYMNWIDFSRTTKSMNLLEKYFDFIKWDFLCTNPHAIHLIEKYPERIKWSPLSTNPNAIHILEQNPDKIDFNWLVVNKRTSYLAEKFPEKIKDLNWKIICSRSDDIDFIKRHSKYILWKELSLNENDDAVELLKQNKNKIDWKELSKNKNMKAIKLLEENIHLLDDWEEISRNPMAIDILKKYPEKIVWYAFSENINIFELDYEFIKKHNEVLNQELIKFFWNPIRLHKLGYFTNDNFND